MGTEVCVEVGRKEKRGNKNTPEDSSILEKNGVCYVGVREPFINKVAYKP